MWSQLGEQAPAPGLGCRNSHRGDKEQTQRLPKLFHIAGSAMLFAITTFGGSHAIIPGFEASAYVRAIERYALDSGVGAISVPVPRLSKISS
jgi:hypothetical protein